jgi:hypothetical protein
VWTGVAPLAHAEGQIGLGSLLQSFPRLQLAVPFEELHWGHGDGLVLRGLSELPVIPGPLPERRGSAVRGTHTSRLKMLHLLDCRASVGPVPSPRARQGKLPIRSLDLVSRAGSRTMDEFPRGRRGRGSRPAVYASGYLPTRYTRDRPIS